MHTVDGVPSCQVCGDPLTGQTVACPACDTLHHRDCWNYLGHCSIYGCSGQCEVQTRVESALVPAAPTDAYLPLSMIEEGKVLRYSDRGAKVPDRGATGAVEIPPAMAAAHIYGVGFWSPPHSVGIVVFLLSAIVGAYICITNHYSLGIWILSFFCACLMGLITIWFPGRPPVDRVNVAWVARELDQWPVLVAQIRDGGGVLREYSEPLPALEPGSDPNKLAVTLMPVWLDQTDGRTRRHFTLQFTYDGSAVNWPLLAPLPEPRPVEGRTDFRVRLAAMRLLGEQVARILHMPFRAVFSASWESATAVGRRSESG